MASIELKYRNNDEVCDLYIDGEKVGTYTENESQLVLHTLNLLSEKGKIDFDTN